MADAFSDAFSFLKALQPSPHHMDAGMPEDQMRHFANMQQMKQRYGRPNAPIPFNPNHPDPNIPIFTEEFAALNPFMAEANREHLGLPPLNPQSQRPMNAEPYARTAGGPRTLPPNPPLMPPVTRGARTQRSPREIGMPMHPTVAPRPLSEDNPYGRIRESELQRLADDYGIPFTKAWTMLKADPELNIREMANYSSAYPMNRRESMPGQMTTMNPIIARLIRERNEQRGAPDFMRQQPDEPHKLEQDYYLPESGDNRPYSHYGPQGKVSMSPTRSYREQIEHSKDAHEAQGVVPGDNFSGDYVARPSGGTATDTGRRRQKTALSNSLEFPYGGRSGNYPVNVQPGSPMAQMYEIAPQLRRLPENMQPDFMSEFRD
tara:strand:- start:1383 stop:2510 length:1128 start_codon:yes stop_codon:yes gene_type:complete